MEHKLEVESQINTGWIDKFLFWGLCLMLFFIPLATSPTIITGGIVLALWLFSGKFIKDRHQWLNQAWLIPVIIFMLLPWMGLLWTNDVTTGLDFAKKSYYWLYAFAIASLTLSRHSVTTLLNAFIAGLTLFSIVSLMQALEIIPMMPMIKELPTISTKSITGSLLLVFGMLILSFYFTKASAAKQKGLIISLMLLFFLTLSIGIGRSGYFAFVILSPLIVYNLIGQRHIIKVAVVTVVIIGALFLSPTVQDRIILAANDIKAYQESNPNTSVGLRLHMWQGAVKMFLENPILGVGTGGYQLAMKEYQTPQLAPQFHNFSQPHNSYLYIAANFGIVGLILFLWIFVILLKNGWQHRQHIVGFSILAFTLVLLIGSLTDAQIIATATGQLFAIFVGMQRHLMKKTISNDFLFFEKQRHVSDQPRA